MSRADGGVVRLRHLRAPILWGLIAAPVVALAVVVGMVERAPVWAGDDDDGGGSLRLTEVLADAGRGSEEAAFEWVEITNAGEVSVDLGGWRLADNRGEDALPGQTIEPGGWVVVGGSAALAAELPAGVVLVVVEDGRIGNGLANNGDRVLLIAPDGGWVAGVSWGSDRSVTIVEPPPRGQSLALHGEGEWRAAEPSPGAAVAAPVEVSEASGPPAEVEISEVFASAGEGTNDAAFEWVELHNRGEGPVDLGGWTIADNAAVDVVAAGVIGPGGRLVIGGSAEAAGGRVDLVIGDGRIGNGLANGGDVVTLRDRLGRLVDEADYRTPPLPLPEEGRSIARTGAGWVLNTAPSPGSEAVTPLLASLESDAGTTEEPLAPSDVGAEDGGGIPATALVGVALGIPLAAIGGQAVRRRRVRGRASRALGARGDADEERA